MMPTTPAAIAAGSLHHAPRRARARAVAECANYVVVDGDDWWLYHSHWGASAVLADAVAGRTHAMRRIAGHHRSSPADWFSPADCAAGMLVDSTRRLLLLFCAPRQVVQLDLRAALFTVLARAWPGWTVRWAYGGLADLMAYVGVEDASDCVDSAPAGGAGSPAGARVGPHLGPHAGLRAGGWYQAPWWSDAVGTLVTVRHAAGDVLIHPLDLARAPAWAGPALIGRMPPGLRQLAAASWPACGVHLDLGRRAVGLWTASTFPGWQSERFEALWSGWELSFWGDRIDDQLEACHGAVRTPPIRVPAGVVRLAHLLVDAWAEPPNAPHLSWLRGLAPAIGPVTIEGVTAEARQEAPAVPTETERRAAFEALHAIAAAPSPASDF